MLDFFKMLTAAWGLLHVLIIFAFLFESRYSRRKTAILLSVFMVPLLIANFLIFAKFGPTVAAQLLLFTCSLPSLIFFFILARHRDGRFLFTFCFAATLCYEIVVLTLVLDCYLANESGYLLLITRILAFPIVEFCIIKWFRNPYKQLQETVKRTWLSLSMISLIFYVLLVVLSAYPQLITERVHDLPALILVMILMPFIYVALFQALSRQQKLFDMEKNAQLLELQHAAISERVKNIESSREQIKIERHDIRHRLRTVAAMIQNEKYEDAIAYLEASENSLDSTIFESYCQNSVLNAVFNLYFDRARISGIELEQSITLPERLTVDETELSIVICNALENAINAASVIKEGKRIIRVKIIKEPQLILSFSNTYSGEIAFDEQGLPTHSRHGHGYGTKSISAFCKKHNAYCEYKAENGIFTLRIVI